jgi:hypothetical protein
MVAATCQPADANRCTVDRPIPADAPVTRITRVGEDGIAVFTLIETGGVWTEWIS